MITTYEWIISATSCILSKENLQNVVSKVHWRLKASNETHIAETYGVTTLPEAKEQNFVPYEDLTKTQVITWLENILGVVPEPIDGVVQKSKLEKLKDNLNRDLLLKSNPIEVVIPFTK